MIHQLYIKYLFTSFQAISDGMIPLIQIVFKAIWYNCYNYATTSTIDNSKRPPALPLSTSLSLRINPYP